MTVRFIERPVGSKIACEPKQPFKRSLHGHTVLAGHNVIGIGVLATRAKWRRTSTVYNRALPMNSIVAHRKDDSISKNALNMNRIGVDMQHGWRLKVFNAVMGCEAHQMARPTDKN